MKLPTKEVRSILIIDDDRDDYDLVSEAIQEIDPNISVHYIHNCKEVPKYRRQKFDLVLLDINMPMHDGFYWLKSIREHGFADLPIVMYTNSMSPSHIAKAYEEGANLYFSKPDSFTDLVKGLNELIHIDWGNQYSITRQFNNQEHYKTFRFE